MINKKLRKEIQKVSFKSPTNKNRKPNLKNTIESIIKIVKKNEKSIKTYNPIWHIEKGKSYNLFRSKKNGDLLIIESFMQDVLEVLSKISRRYTDWYPIGSFEDMKPIRVVMNNFYKSMESCHKRRNYIVENIYFTSNATLVIPSIYTKKQFNESFRNFIADVDENLNDDTKNPEKWFHSESALVNPGKKYLDPNAKRYK